MVRMAAAASSSIETGIRMRNGFCSIDILLVNSMYRGNEAIIAQAAPAGKKHTSPDDFGMLLIDSFGFGLL